jgi:acetate kinase
MRILVINSGSSSVRFAVFDMTEGNERNVFTGYIDEIGSQRSSISLRDHKGATIVSKSGVFADHDAVFAILPELIYVSDVKKLDAVGHRIVHGGLCHIKPEIVTEALELSLKDLIPLAPDHLPHELNAIAAISRVFPGIAQVACFDTAFHRRMPSVAQTVVLPRNQFTQDIVHYGFHGLSYEYITNKLAADNLLLPKTVIAHLGNGASMAAIRNGICIDTTMSFTPASGLVMSTRSGDLDPSVVIYLMNQGISLHDVNRMINKESGLLGISGISGDMKLLLEKMEFEPRAKLAIDIFCYRIIKSAGAFAAALGGLDQLIFTGGIGENSSFIRKKVCHGLKFLAMDIEDEKNESGKAIISSEKSSIIVRIVKTNEELMIARHAYNLLGEYNGKRNCE